jgi:mannosyl-3-phosphoglycerate phosphatase
MPERGGRLAVVTDLDGCLLDHATYDVTPARRTLRRLRRAGVLLALCTSKTRVEVAALWPRLGAPCPAVIEDGGGLLIPPGTLHGPLPGARRTRHGRLLPLGPPRAAARRVLRRLPREVRQAVRGFGDLTVAEIGRAAGLDMAAARRAARREFDEPLIVRGGDRTRAAIRLAAAAAGLVVTRGGRFAHLHGPSDKGAATQHLRRLLEREHGPLRMVAIGDSPLDAPLLRLADVAVIIPRPDGRPDPLLRRLFPGARVAPAPGPRGWARAVAALLDATPC